MLEIEITEANIIEGGVEVFARAWQDGVQLGFGVDGSIDIERFRIMNPPLLVNDPLGNINADWIDEDGITHTRRLREDPEEATIEVIEQMINSKVYKFTDSVIVAGKIGNTSTAFYSSAVDGRVAMTYVSPGSWATIRDGAGNGSDYTSSIAYYRLRTTAAGSLPWHTIERGIFGFDTSALGADTINSGTFAVKGTTTSTDQWADNLVLDRTVPASSTALANTDYNATRWDEVEQATARLDLGTWNDATWNTWTLNATGEGNVDGSGITWLGIRGSADFDDVTPTWVSNVSGIAYWLTSEQGGVGTTEDPVLTIDHTAGGSPASDNALSMCNF